MSHYYYENAFDFIDSTGTLGYSIEQDKTLTSDSLGVVAGADDYIIEVHYLGNAATTLKLNVSNIDNSALTDVNYVQKGFAYRSGEDGNVNVDTYNTTLEAINAGQTSYSLQQGGLDPAFGMVQLHIPSTLTAQQQTDLGRDSDYLYMESALYFDVIQQDTALVSSLQGLIDETVTLTEFATAIDSALADPAVVPANVVLDATNDITSHAPSNGYNSLVDQNPDMIHFDNINYYSYDDFSSAPRMLTVSETSTVPSAGGTSEASLVGEFRISENSGSEWSINADFRISQNTDTTWQTDLLPVTENNGGHSHNINDSFNNSGISRTFVEAATTISRNADGVLSFSETVPIINTLTDSSAVTLSSTIDYQGLPLHPGTYSIDVYGSQGNNHTIQLREIFDTNSNGYFSYGGSQAISIMESDGARYFSIVDDINDGVFTITNPNMISDGLGTQWNGVWFTSNSNIHYENNDGTMSSDGVPAGDYLVTGSGNDITLTEIVGDTDFDYIPELDSTSAYKLYVNEAQYYNEVEYFYDSVINDPNSGVGNWENYVKGVDYETSETVIPIMDELDTTWNSVTISGGNYTAVDGTSITSGTYKVSVSSVDGSVSLHETTVLGNGDYDLTASTFELRSDSQTSFIDAVNRGAEVTYDYTYKQYFYDLINTDTVDGAEVITHIDEHVNLLGGTKYVDGAAFDNTGVNSINTADVSSITSIDAGDEGDFIAGGVGGLTIDGGSGMDMYLSTPASINIVEDQDGNIISERGVTVDLSANRVIYIKDGTEDVVSNIEYFMGTLGDDLFYGSALHTTNIDPSYTSALQVFNPTAGKDEIFGAKDTYDLNGNLIEVLTAVDYDAMQGGQGVIFILDGSDAAINAAVGNDELSFANISQFAGDYWNDTSWAGDGWLPSNEDILNSSGNFSTQSRYEAEEDGATLILDSFGDTDLAFDVDHYIGSSETDIFFGSIDNDSFDAGTGAGNFMSGGAGLDTLVVTDYNDIESDGNGGTQEDDENLNLNSMVIDRVTDTHLHNVIVDTGGTSNKFVSTASQTQTGDTLYRIDFADVQDLSTFYTANISSDLYNVSSSYELYLSTSVGDIGSAINGYTGIQYVTDHNKIDVAGNDLSILSSLSGQGQFILQETTVRVGEYTVKGTDNFGSEYSTVIKDVEQVVLTDDEVNYFGTGNIRGSQEDIYQLIQGGQGDLGEMLYVTTGQTIDNATGASNYSGGLNFNNSDVFYSGHHTDFDRNSSRDGWAASVGQAFTASEAKVWNDEVAQFFVWYDADATDNIEGYEIAVKYQNGDINAWGIDNRQFDTFQNVTVDQALADAIKAQFGDSVSVELGEYRVLYEAAYTDIETIVNSNADVTKWNFDFQPTSSRSTFYIQVGGGETGLNGSAGISDTLVTNIKVERVVDGDGFKWNVNPEAEILVNLPILPGDANDNVLISGDSAETIEAGKGSDVMMGQGGSDNYKISAGDTRDVDGNEVVGSYGVAGDVINEIGGSSEDKSDAITLSSAKSIDELSFSRTQIASEYWDNTLKIDVKYDSGAEDTLYVFDHYNQDLSSRAVEQLFLDDGWDSSEIWNLIVGDVNLATGIDEYTGTAGQDILIAGTTKSSLYGGDGQDILIGDQRGKETIFELGNRDSAWDQVADIIEGFGTGDHLDLSALGISDETEIKIDNNQLQLSDDTVVAEFRNFNDGLTLEQLLTEDGAITYSAA